ncbi:hypothetical protein K1Y78_62305, partial [Streptomyces sp. tea 10]|nr:hypothetical protein [Streptomyces sp. tea 10]
MSGRGAAASACLPLDAAGKPRGGAARARARSGRPLAEGVHAWCGRARDDAAARAGPSLAEGLPGLGG